MHKRSRLLVDPKVQWSIAGRVICHWLMFTVCLLTVGTMIRVLVAAGTQPAAASFRGGLVAQWPILIVMLILLPIFVHDTLKLSNRFAGPMYRLRTALRSLATDQKTGPIKFRTGDFWLEAADDFNHVLGQLDRLQHENEQLRAELADGSSSQSAVSTVKFGKEEEVLA